MSRTHLKLFYGLADSSPRNPRVAVVVMGELSRSPRMLNHATQMRAIATPVLIGYASRGSDFNGIEVLPVEVMARAGDGRSRAVFLLISAIRMARLLPAAYRALVQSRARVILVQNPPSFPTLIAASLAARRLGAKLIVDWHNYGYSLLALRLGERHPVVRLSRWYEAWAARRADAHLCVSQAMREDLRKRWNIAADVLYDRPIGWDAPDRRRDAALTIVCPSGWTKDERMDILFDALEQLRGMALRVHLTGEGPLRALYDSRIARLRESGMDVRPGFLSESDYRGTIRSADLGVSLHASSSGLDLAMKVVDFFAAGVPVCALDYGGALGEQVRPGANGYVFKDAGSLAAILRDCVANREGLERMRTGMLQDRGESWAEAWDRVARTLVLE